LPLPLTRPPVLLSPTSKTSRTFPFWRLPASLTGTLYFLANTTQQLLSLRRTSKPFTHVSLAKLARENQLSPEDLQGSTFSISNIGSIGGTYARYFHIALDSTAVLMDFNLSFVTNSHSHLQPRHCPPSGVHRSSWKDSDSPKVCSLFLQSLLAP